MNAADYQQQAARTLIDEPDFPISGNDMMVLWCTIGLTGEAGEIAEMVKKGILHQHGIDKEKLEKEVGDCLWYLAGICTKAGIDLGAAMQGNIDKLWTRYPNGFSSDDSKARVDVIDYSENDE